MRRYLVLLVVAAVLSVVVYRLGGRTVTSPPPSAPPEPDSIAVTVTLTDHGVEPAVVTVPKDHRVVLTLVNHRRLATRVTLQGYAGAVAPGVLAPGASWRGRFLADRPGDGFAWMVDGEPAGRLVVTGSHLVEGHR